MELGAGGVSGPLPSRAGLSGAQRRSGGSSSLPSMARSLRDPGCRPLPLRVRQEAFPGIPFLLALFILCSRFTESWSGKRPHKSLVRPIFIPTCVSLQFGNRSD